MGEARLEGAETARLGCLDLCSVEPKADGTGRRGNRSPADGRELEFARGRDGLAAGRNDFVAEEEETVASTVVLVLGILNRKEKRNKARVGTLSEEKEKKRG